MYRVVKMKDKFYAQEMKSVEVDIDEIEGSLDMGYVVILCDDLVDLKDLVTEDIEIIEE